MPIYSMMFLVCVTAGALAAFFGASLVAMAIGRRANSALAACCAVPGVTLLAVAVFAFRAAHQFLAIKLPPGG